MLAGVQLPPSLPLSLAAAGLTLHLIIGGGHYWLSHSSQDAILSFGALMLRMLLPYFDTGLGLHSTGLPQSYPVILSLTQAELV